MKEQAPKNIEVEQSNQESLSDSKEKAYDRAREALQSNLESNPERSNDIEKTRDRIAEEASSAAEVSIDTSESNFSATPSRTKHSRNQIYADTLAQIRSRLSGPEKTFSKVIHNPVVEKASETLEKTIARPSVSLGGAMLGFIGTTVVYFVSKRYGYEMSNLTFIYFVIIGSILGLILEWVRSLFSKN